MSEEGPKLYTNKPKKAQLKASSASARSAAPSSGAAATAAAAASYKMGSQSASASNPPPPPPPPPPKESFLRRYKFLIPLVLGVNLAFGAYLFMRTKKNDTGVDEEVTSNISSPSASSTAAATLTDKPTALPTVSEPLKIRDPIPENQQRELFKWILEQKRKVKPKDPEEKKRLDEEKAILKQFIRAKSIPNI